MGENQYLKLLQRKRAQYFGMILPTLTNPDLVLEEYDPVPNGERETKLIFIKTFIKPKGTRYVHFESVAILRDRMEPRNPNGTKQERSGRDCICKIIS